MSNQNSDTNLKLKAGREYRGLAFFDVEVSTKRFDTDYYVEGYATTFKPYEFYEDSDGIVYEHFLPEAFRDTDMSDVIFQYNHDGRVFARQSNQTLFVQPDSHGLFIAADLGKTEAARQIYEDIKSGMTTRMSWGFRMGDVEYDKKTRTIIHKSVKKIYDVSAVSIPANQQTEIFAREFADGVIRQAEQEWLKRSRDIDRIKLLIDMEVLHGTNQ